VCRGDGNQVSAGIDIAHWPHEGGVMGFGDTLADALRDLAKQIDEETGPIPFPESRNGDNNEQQK
jgi:predicted RNase H-like HicB family nuclease